jgi:hypothetical protein
MQAWTKAHSSTLNGSRDEVSVEHRGNNKKWVNNEQGIKGNLWNEALGVN